MSSLYKKLIMVGVSAGLIPLGKTILSKIVKKGVSKISPKSGGEEEELTPSRETAAPEAL